MKASVKFSWSLEGSTVLISSCPSTKAFGMQAGLVHFGNFYGARHADIVR